MKPRLLVFSFERMVGKAEERKLMPVIEASLIIVAAQLSSLVSYSGMRSRGSIYCMW